ncbi:MAG: TPM domain-containing protein, partial [Myxococcota bacterium]
MSSALLATLLLLSTTPDQIPNPRSHGSWIADTAEVISAADRAVIDSKIDALERELGVEIAVVTVKDVDRTPREFATGLM